MELTMAKQLNQYKNTKLKVTRPSTILSPKKLDDGRAMLNLGAGWKMHWGWNNLDFSLYSKLSHSPNIIRVLKVLRLLSKVRQERLAKVDPTIVCWDLRNGIPYKDDTFDVIYHSHFLEHLDREVAPEFFLECYRTLKVGGVIRVVVPDWELLVHRYLNAVKDWDANELNANLSHADAMEELIEQMIRKGAIGSSNSGILGKMENFFRGGAVGTGESHRWMYDRLSLAELLTKTGFRSISKLDEQSSSIKDWHEYKLDIENGQPYKKYSLYMEAIK